MDKIDNRLIIAGILLLAFSGGAMVIYNQTRGYRNNNPGNIRHGSNWQGMKTQQTDSAFVQFISPEYGIRALGKVLLNYEKLYGLRTVRGIISRWAPTNENDTESYVLSVSRSVGVAPDAEINVGDNLYGLTRAIIKHENGFVLYPDNVIKDGLAMV